MSKAKTRRLSSSSVLSTKAAPQYSIPHPDTMPDRYVVHCSGTCLEPDISDGAPVLVEKHGKIASGDLVVLFFKPEHAQAGKYPAILKRLVLAPPPYVSFPWREHPQSDVHALIIVEMLNPPKQFAYKCEHLLGVHKCVGRVPESMTLDVEGQTYQTHAGKANLADNRQAVLARAEQMIEILGERFVCAGWHEQFDQQRAAEFLDAVRREDLSGDDEQSQSVITSWIADHGQSLDWLYLGNPGGLICGAAHRAFRAP